MATRFRAFTESDYPALQALDLAAQRRADPGYDALPDRERESRLSTSLAALKFYGRTEHSFVAEEGEVFGFVLAQSVWQGDRPAALIRTLTAAEGAPADTAAGLLHAVVKSAYDSAVYEVHFPAGPDLLGPAQAEEAHLLGSYAVIHLGTRAETAPGEKLRRTGGN